MRTRQARLAYEALLQYRRGEVPMSTAAVLMQGSRPGTTSGPRVTPWMTRQFDVGVFVWRGRGVHVLLARLQQLHAARVPRPPPASKAGGPIAGRCAPKLGVSWSWLATARCAVVTGGRPHGSWARNRADLMGTGDLLSSHEAEYLLELLGVTMPMDQIRG